jgi:hypothetical protein
MFDCTLIYYIDKFGYKEINKAIEKIFIWAYKIRLTYQNVQLASLDNYVLQKPNFFRIIKDSISPEDLFTVSINAVETVKSTKTEKIEQLFKDLKYDN